MLEGFQQSRFESFVSSPLLARDFICDYVSKSVAIPTSATGNNQFRQISYDKFPPYLDFAISQIDDVCVVSSREISISGFSLSAEDGFLVAPNFGFVNSEEAVPGGPVTITIGGNSYSITREEDVFPAEQISLAEGAGVTVAKTGDIFSFEDLKDLGMEDIRRCRETILYVALMPVGTGSAFFSM